MYNRYKFLKKLYKNYVIIIKRKEKYYSYNIDLEILKYINSNNINYIIIENLNIIKKVKYADNTYSKYFYFCKILYIIKKGINPLL